jgi:hypothetical protein
MNTKLISAALTLIAITASTSSFARGNDIELNYTATQATTAKPNTRDAVHAQLQAAHAFTQLNGDLYGSVTLPSDAMALTREQVRMQARDYVRSHKRDMNDLG